MNALSIISAAEAKIIDLENQVSKAAADAKSSGLTAQGTISTLQAQVAELQKQVDANKGAVALTDAEKAELLKLAALVNVDPETGNPLPPHTGV